jgi:hypothetical protein
MKVRAQAVKNEAVDPEISGFRALVFDDGRGSAQWGNATIQRATPCCRYPGAVAPRSLCHFWHWSTPRWVCEPSAGNDRRTSQMSAHHPKPGYRSQPAGAIPGAMSQLGPAKRPAAAQQATPRSARTASSNTTISPQPGFVCSSFFTTQAGAYRRTLALRSRLLLPRSTVSP